MGWRGLVLNIFHCLPLLQESWYIFVLHTAVFTAFTPYWATIVRWEKIKAFIRSILDFWSRVFLTLFRYDRVPFNREHNDLMWYSKERRLSNITPRFLTYIFHMPYRIVNCYLKRISPFFEIWSCKKNALSFIWIHFQTIFTVPFFHCF